MKESQKKLLKSAALLVAAYMLFNSFRKIKAVSKIDCNFKNIAIDKKKTNIFNLSLIVKWDIANLSDTDLKFEGIAGTLYINGSYLGNVKMFPASQITLKAKQNTVVESSIDIQTAYALPVLSDTISKVIAGGNIPLKFYFDGDLYAGGLPFKFNDTYDYSFTSTGTWTASEKATKKETSTKSNTSLSAKEQASTGKAAQSKTASKVLI